MRKMAGKQVARPELTRKSRCDLSSGCGSFGFLDAADIHLRVHSCAADTDHGVSQWLERWPISAAQRRHARARVCLALRKALAGTTIAPLNLTA